MDYAPTAPELLSDEVLLAKVKEQIKSVCDLRQYMKETANPITVITLKKDTSLSGLFDHLDILKKHLRIVVFVDEKNNNIDNPYMLVWRVVNNMDASRDLRIADEMVYIDGTNKNKLDGFERRWPDDVSCTPAVVETLKKRGLWDLNKYLEELYQL